MAIYDSTPSSSAVNHLLAFLLPDRLRVRDVSHMDRMVSARPAPSSGGPLNSSALGWTACVGLSLILVRYIGSRRERVLAYTEQDESSDPGSTVALLYQLIHEQLTRLRDLILSSRNEEDYDRDEELDGESLVVHQGSCHCGSIAFEVSAPLVLQVDEDLSGKLSYPSTRVPESSFKLLRGEDIWQTYYVPDEQTEATQAFSFCRNCAVHLVHAIDSDPFMVSFNVNCLTTPWKKAKSRSLGLSAFPRRSRPKKRSSPARSTVARRAAINDLTPRTPELRSSSPPSSQRSPSPISFDSKLTDSPTPPQEDDGPVGEIVRTTPAALFQNKEDSLSLSSDKFSSAENSRHYETWGDRTDDANRFTLKRKPVPRYRATSSLDWPTDTTDASSYLYADDEHSLNQSSVHSAPSGASSPAAGSVPRDGASGISANHALREKLRSHMGKHMKSTNRS